MTTRIQNITDSPVYVPALRGAVDPGGIVAVNDTIAADLVRTDQFAALAEVDEDTEPEEGPE